jgi:rhomboid protease GluP
MCRGIAPSSPHEPSRPTISPVCLTRSPSVRIVSEAPPDDSGVPSSPDAGELVLLRLALDRDRADELALVLAAVGVPYHVARSGQGDFALIVPLRDAERAERALVAYDRDVASTPPEPPPAPVRGVGALGPVLALLLLGFFIVTGPWEAPRDLRWFTTGDAAARQIRAGEWWRAITAMTLHADVMHVVGNAIGSLIFVTAAARWLGSGLAATLVLVAGAAANLLTARVESLDHLSVGASTATFAALGIIAGLQVVRRWRGGGMPRRRAWVAMGAGLALFAMLGVGPRADVFAHLFGLGCGFVLGIGAGIVVDRPGAPRLAPVPEAPPASIASGVPVRLGARAWLWQAALAAGALAGVAAAWLRALRP